MSTVDPEMLEAFQTEMKELEPILQDAADQLDRDFNQPDQFAAFAQVVDRIYGTALTLGFQTLGEYSGVLREICRRCAETKIQRAMQPSAKIVVRYMKNYVALRESLSNPSQLEDIRSVIAADTARIKKMDEEIFAFSKD